MKTRILLRDAWPDVRHFDPHAGDHVDTAMAALGQAERMMAVRLYEAWLGGDVNVGA